MKQQQALENSYIVETFTRAILETVYSIKIRKTEIREIINADLIPNIGEKLTKKHLLSTRETQPLTPSILQEFKQTPRPNHQRQIQQRPQTSFRQMQRARAKIKARPAPQNLHLPAGEFGKLDTLIKNPSITTIECPGHEKFIAIIRSGLKQPTRITLTANEITNILEKIAQEARIPLIDGVFRAAIRDFVVEAVISDAIGTRFVLKKVNPYALLEQRK